MMSLDEALSDLRMLNTDSRCSNREYIQDIESKYEQRKAENAKWLKWQQQADIVRADERKSAAYGASNQDYMDSAAFGSSQDEIPAFGSSKEQISAFDSSQEQISDFGSNEEQIPTTNILFPSVSSATDSRVEHKPVSEFTRIMNQTQSNSQNVVVTDPANSSSNSISIQINQGVPTIHKAANLQVASTNQPRMGPLHMRGRGSCMMPPILRGRGIPPTLRGLSSRAMAPSILSRDSQFVTNITIQQKHSHIPYYSNYKLENDAFNRRMQFNPRRMWNVNQRQQYSSPYPVITLPPSIPPCTAVQRYHCGPYPQSVVKLSGVLTSFKQRTLRTRARVRFCVREETTDQDDLTAQLANIKLDTSSFKLNENGRSGLSLTTGGGGLIGCGFADFSRRRESTPISSTTDDAEGFRSRLVVEPRSRHMSLEPNDPLIRSDLLATSLNNLDLDESSE